MVILQKTASWAGRRGAGKEGEEEEELGRAFHQYQNANQSAHPPGVPAVHPPPLKVCVQPAGEPRTREGWGAAVEERLPTWVLSPVPQSIREREKK